MAHDSVNWILSLLGQSKNGSQVENLPRDLIHGLEGLDVRLETDGSISRDARISLAVRAITLGCDVEEVIEQLTWKDFEGFVARVLLENDYQCIESFRRRGNRTERGMEIDVIGIKGSVILAIDAKMWGVRSSKASALRSAVSKQSARTARLANELDRLSARVVAMKAGEYTLIPILVTWLVEEVEIHEGVPVVPIFKLNAFLFDLNRFDDLVITFDGRLTHQFSQTKL
jgi:hypothetical protein